MAGGNGQLTATSPKRTGWWIKAFVIFHAFAIAVWAIPDAPSAVREGKERPKGSDWLRIYNTDFLKYSPIKYYLLTTGFWQSWDMFAPNPANTDFYGDAEVVYKNGSHKVYQYPRMYTLPLHTKYLKERYRKFYERAHMEQYAFLWTPFAQRVALVNYTDPNNPPATIKLHRHWLPVAPPGLPQEAQYHDYVYFTYVVDQEKLARDSGMHESD